MRKKKVVCTGTSGFNPRPRTEGDGNKQDQPGRTTKFQSTPPHGGRPYWSYWSNRPRWFQSTPPHGGRRRERQRGRALGGFNPRPRTEGDQRQCSASSELLVSIHAPARRATPSCRIHN